MALESGRDDARENGGAFGEPGGLMKEEYAHRPVLLDECIEALCIQPDGVYVDGTFGRGGHSVEIVKRLTGNGRLVCIDQDQQALREGAEKLAPWRQKVTFLHGNFRELDELLDAANIPVVDGMLFDLGVSSPQLDDPIRGFSYQKDAPLDMRMNREDTLTAKMIVNQWSKEELRRIISQYGEERYAAAIASAICRARNETEIETTLQLVEIIRSAMPSAALREKQHPAKRSFQGIRIAVNDELGAIAQMLSKAIARLGSGGRLAVISFHSLEDRIVKTEFAAAAKGCDCPPTFPVCVCGKKPIVRLLSRKPVLPNDEELKENPRSRSAKLRIAEKI
jgi:16S rRNA (cytosine1402-N4)-methyltransferase